MSAAPKFDPYETIERQMSKSLSRAEADPVAERMSAIENALVEMRQEFREMRDMLVERERKGSLLIDAYKQVLADLADLFEAQRHENIKREESIRFFLSSIEARLAADLRADLGLGRGEGGRRGAWPFRRAA